jgi:hypothetical protein
MTSAGRSPSVFKKDPDGLMKTPPQVSQVSTGKYLHFASTKVKDPQHRRNIKSGKGGLSWGGWGREREHHTQEGSEHRFWTKIKIYNLSEGS